MTNSTELQQLIIPVDSYDEKSNDNADIKITNKPSHCNFYFTLSILSLLTFFCFLITCKLYLIGEEYNEQITCISNTFVGQNTTNCIIILSENNCTTQVFTYQNMLFNHYPILFLSIGFIMLGLFGLLILVACTGINYGFKYGYLSSTIIMILTLILISLSMFNNLTQNSQIIINNAHDCYILDSDVFTQIIKIGQLPTAYIFGVILTIYITSLILCNIELILNICKKKIISCQTVTASDKIIQIVTWILLWGVIFLSVLGFIGAFIFLSATSIIFVGNPIPSPLTILCFGCIVLFCIFIGVFGYGNKDRLAKIYRETCVVNV